MIQWIALAVAIDAEGKAANAQRTASEAAETAHNNGPAQMVILHDFGFDRVEIRPNRTFWDKFFGTGLKNVIQKKPMKKFSVKRGDILNMEEFTDDDGTPYVKIKLSEYAKIKGYSEDRILISVDIPGTLEEAAAVLG